MSALPMITHGTQDNFNETVITASTNQPVLVDFWADWCAPCKALMPMLEALAEEYSGAFTLVKVNADTEQALAAQYGVRSLPTVKLFKDGQPVDEFMGALPESQIREFLSKHVASAIDQQAEAAIKALELGDTSGAQALFNQVFSTQPHHLNSLLALAENALDRGATEEAQQFFEQISSDDRAKPEVVKLKAKLTVATSATETDMVALEAAVSKHPDDLDARMALGNAQIAVGDYAKGLNQYLEVVQRDRNFDDSAARSAALNVFNMLGSQDSLVREYRRKLASLLN